MKSAVCLFMSPRVRRAFHGVALVVSIGVCAATATAASSQTPDAVLKPGTAGTDDAQRIQAAFDALKPYQRLVIQPGNYTVGTSLRLAVDGAKVSGYGATFTATDPDDQALFISGHGEVLTGLTLRGVGDDRLSTLESAKVVVTGQGIQVLDTTIDGSASVGIFVNGGQNVVIADNTVRNTLADGIHTTGGSKNVLVSGNTVAQTGDDMISVVSYRSDKTASSNVLVTGNTLLGNRWGRGISVVGGVNLTFENNTVSGVAAAAGILVAQEDSWNTFGVDNVIVRNNTVSNIENATLPAGESPAQHAAIDLNTGNGTVTRVWVDSNRISQAAFGGVRALGNVCRFQIDGTQLSDVKGVPINMSDAACMPTLAVCSRNTNDGQPMPALPECAGTASVGVTGANVSALPVINQAERRSSQSGANASMLSSAK
jgi:parallel beta-helix repeat protein